MLGACGVASSEEGLAEADEGAAERGLPHDAYALSCATCAKRNHFGYNYRMPPESTRDLNDRVTAPRIPLERRGFEGRGRPDPAETQ